MNKILKSIVLGIFVGVILNFCSCSFRIGSNDIIINNKLELFINQRNFEDEMIKEYKIKDMVICPFFRYEKENRYSIYCSIYNKGAVESEIIINSISLKYDGTEVNRIINQRKKFKKMKDKYWGNNVWFVGFVLSENEAIKINKKSKIKITMDISVEDKRNVIRKIIEYDYKYKRTYFFIDFTQ